MVPMQRQGRAGSIIISSLVSLSQLLGVFFQGRAGSIIISLLVSLSQLLGGFFRDKVTLTPNITYYRDGQVFHITFQLH